VPADVRHVYIVVREDLPTAHQAVQAIHAAIAATHTFGEPRRTHPHLVLCGLPSESELYEFHETLKASGVQHCIYTEPDMGEAYTALATAPLPRAARKHFRRLRLWLGTRENVNSQQFPG
jgi:hypothetical protein